MPQLSRIGLTTLTLVVLCLGAASVARADTITFTGERVTINAPPPGTNLGRCGSTAPPILLVSLPPGTGTSNLGSLTTNESHCVNRATGALFNGLFAFDVGSGNTFFGTYTGVIGLTGPPVVGVFYPVVRTLSVTNGTGLFAGASGTLASVGTVTFFADGTSNSRESINGTITTVPEPTTMLLLGTGLAGIAAKVRKRRKAA